MTIYKGKIKGDLTLAKGDDATKVTSIGGYLYVSEGATCDLPLVTSIGGYPIPNADAVHVRLKAIAEQVVNNPATLEMGKWHCGTTHCLAGWAVHLASSGYQLEKKVGSTLLAGNILLSVEPSRLFFAEKGKVLAMLQGVLDAGSANA